MTEIETKNGIYKYEMVNFLEGAKVINREISKDNLLTLKKCFDKNELSFAIMYGTLLGAVREGNFIEHDEDTDIFILNEDRDKLLDLLFEMRELGFEVGRYNHEMVSFMKNGEYIDVYFFIKQGRKRSNSGYVVDAECMENLENYVFLETNFQVPKNPEKLLSTLYGDNWRIPDKNGKPINYGLYQTIRHFIQDNFKILFTVIRWIKQTLHV